MDRDFNSYVLGHDLEMGLGGRAVEVAVHDAVNLYPHG
jgi:hypothetical protein